jgi:hypothetical protein
VLGVHRHPLTELEVRGQFQTQGAHGAVEQELEGEVGQFAQHAAEVLGRGQALLAVEAPGKGG